jgi:hypothetical protein
VTSVEHVAGTEAMTSKKSTKKIGSAHSRDQDVEGNRKKVTGYWVDSISLRSWTAFSSFEHVNQYIG